MTLSPKLGVVEIITLWHFRLPLLIQMFIKVASSPRLSGIGMTSPILWSHLLKMKRIVMLSSLLWWELGTNSLITGPGEWLSLRRFTSKLSWSWSWWRNVLGAKRPGPKSQAAKRPGPKYQGAKRPGPKLQEGETSWTTNIKGETTLSETSGSETFRSKRSRGETSWSKISAGETSRYKTLGDVRPWSKMSGG